jgi:hypothetical protein
MTRITGLFLISVLVGCGDVADAPGDPDANAEVDGALGDVDAGPAPSWDLAADFPGGGNPHGVWTYAYASTLGGALQLFPDLSDDAGTPTWYDDELPNAGSIWKNLTDDTPYGSPAGWIAMHPGYLGELPVIRFTAPAAAMYQARVEILDGDSGATEVLVRVAGAGVFATQTAATYDLPATELAADQTIEIWVDYLGDWTSDNTPVSLVVNEVEARRSLGGPRG